MKWIENRKNTVKNRWNFVRFFLRVVVSMWLCEYVWVCAYACMGYSFVSMCVCMSLSEFTNTSRYISGCEFVGVS